MCSGCWEDYGKPELNSPEIQYALRAVQEVYEYSCVGGGLHIVLDDWNLEDSSVEWCAVHLESPEHWEYLQRDKPDLASAQLAAERRCLALFQPLTVAERASVLARLDGFVDPPPPQATQRPSGVWQVVGFETVDSLEGLLKQVTVNVQWLPTPETPDV
jgi:hypothetical protein